MSLKSRLDIICDEADGDMHESESSHDILPEKLIPQADIQLLRCVGIYFHVLHSSLTCFLFVISFSLLLCWFSIQDVLITLSLMNSG